MLRRNWDSRIRNSNTDTVLNASRAVMIIGIAVFIWKISFLPSLTCWCHLRSLTAGPRWLWRSESCGPASGTVNRYAKHVFNCLKPRNALYLTTAYFKVCQLWGFSELAVSLFEHAHENTCEWLILIAASWGQILGCVDEFLLHCVEELSELGSSQTSYGNKGVQRKSMSAGGSFSVACNHLMVV